MKYCIADVSGGYTFKAQACSNPARPGSDYCGTHSPEAEARRDAKAAARREKQSEEARDATAACNAEKAALEGFANVVDMRAELDRLRKELEL